MSRFEFAFLVGQDDLQCALVMSMALAVTEVALAAKFNGACEGSYTKSSCMRMKMIVSIAPGARMLVRDLSEMGNERSVLQMMTSKGE